VVATPADEDYETVLTVTRFPGETVSGRHDSRGTVQVTPAGPATRQWVTERSEALGRCDPSTEALRASQGRIPLAPKPYGVPIERRRAMEGVAHRAQSHSPNGGILIPAGHRDCTAVTHPGLVPRPTGTRGWGVEHIGSSALVRDQAVPGGVGALSQPLVAKYIERGCSGDRPHLIS